MLLKEMSFRDIVDKYLYINAAGVAQGLGSIFEVTEDTTGLLCYGYIDDEAGVTLEILCCAVHDEQAAKLRLAELPEAKAAVLPGDMPRLSEFHSKVERIRQAYKPDEARAAMRSLTSLDPVRLPAQPDIVTVYLVHGEEAEVVPVLLEEVREVKLIGTLLAEPQMAVGLHKGDELSFFLVRNEKGIMCMAVVAEG